MFPVRYELGFYIPEDGFFIVTTVKTSTLTQSKVLFSVPCQAVELGVVGNGNLEEILIS
jgi:hypothetical protein